MRHVFAALLALAGCHERGSSTRDGALADAASADVAPFVGGGPYVPATMRFRAGPVASFDKCEWRGTTIEYAGRVIVDDCVECQCTTFGMRCHKRASCADDRCVFIDGQVVAQGGSAVVETCFDCTCDANGGTCRRKTDAPCPADACKLADQVLALGAERHVSECHACTCDANAGLVCSNLCNAVCECTDAKPACSLVCAEHGCPIAIADQDRIQLSCGTPVCDYGLLVGAPACD